MRTEIEKSRGFTLIEMLVYVAVLAGIFILVVNTVLSFTKNYREVRALKVMDQTAMISLERITREIRSASSADTSQPSVLSLTQTSGSISTTTRFYVEGGALKIAVNGAYVGPLSVTGSSITSLAFAKVTNATSTLVKIDMGIQGVSGQITKSKIYHTSVVLRGQ